VRVALVHNLPPGGARRVLAEHAGRLGRETVELCLGSAAPVGDGALVFPYAPLAPRVAPALRPALRYADLGRLLAAWRRLAAALPATRADVVLAHPCQFLQAPPVLLWTGLPTVYFCHEPRRVDHEPAARLTRNPRTRRLYFPLYRAERALDGRATRAAGRLVTNSAYTARQIRAAYGREADALPLGVPDAFRPAPSPSAASPGAPGHVLSVGALIPTKGHDLALEAAALANRRRPVLVVAPRPDAGEERRLLARAAQLGVALEVRTAISEEELCAAFQAAFATLYLARDEPFGLASLEAQACGCPVVVAAEGGLPETILAGATGWAVPREAAAAAACLDRLEDPVVRAAFAQRAAAHGSQASWGASAAAMAAVLDEVAAR
jgi:glycosyltransferase involved in cell wall biosynthesis